MFVKYLRITVLLLISSIAFSQELSESDILQIRKVQGQLVSSPEEAYVNALEISKSNNEIFRWNGEYYVANYFYNKSDYKHSKQLLTTLLERIEKSGKATSNKRYRDLMGMCVNKLFYLHKNLGEYSLALSYLDQYKNHIPNDRFNEQYGIVKVAMGDYANGIVLLKKEVMTSRHLKLGEGEDKAMNDKLFADKYNTIGEAYQKYYIQSHKKAYLDSADYYFSRAVSLMVYDNLQLEYTKALFFMRKAKSAALMGDFSKALKLYREREKYPVIKQNIRTVQLFDLGMADCFYHLKQPDSALDYSKRYIKNYEVTKISKENLLIAYNILSQCYEDKKDNKNAYRYAQKSLELIASMDTIKNKSLNFIHNYDLESIKAESNAMIASRNYFKAGLFGILAVLAFVVFGFYYYYSTQKRKHQRFLKIIQKLKAAKPIPATSTETTEEPLQKQLMDAEFIEKITLGLRKLEKKETYLQTNFKLAFVAKKLNTNTAYLSQYFNQVMRKTFSEYTQELRINYVLQKLHDNTQFRSYTLQAIAEEVGYKDATTFVRVFKKQTGLSPNYYIEELRK